MRITFAEPSQPKAGAVAVAVADGGTLSPAAKALDKRTKGAIAKAVKVSSRFDGKKDQMLEIVAPGGVENSRILVYGVEEKTAPLDLQAQGGRLFARLAASGERDVSVHVDIGAEDLPAAAAEIAFGALLASYRFDKYKTQDEKDRKPALRKIAMHVKGAAAARRAYQPMARIGDGVFMTRNLVSEPPNEIYPESLAAAAKDLTELGVKVQVLGEKQMAKLGMGALLGVGKGSARESQLVVMQWNGAPRSKAPVAFVGKGVTFDSGGLSLKPPAGMMDMKWDMGGAGVVVGLMKAVAGRKARANVVGVVGAVENMPDGGAQRPGDIVKTMSGQTVEVLNTDAEGRLVLADALWYTQDRFKPSAMVDLATLTGAIMIALGPEYAGMFSNDDGLSDALTECGRGTGERVWRMPLGGGYDEMLRTAAADMKNIGGRDAGACTAAQFLHRFVNGTKWAHLDIAAVTWSGKDKATVPKGATGFGVRLLDRYVRDYAEKGAPAGKQPE